MKRSIILFLLILASTQLHAQDIVSNTQGVTISATLNYCRWSSTILTLDELEPNGAGFGLRVGYGFNQRLEMYARMDAHSFKFNLPEKWDTYGMVGLEGGLRLNLGGTLQRLRPFFEAGYTQQFFVADPISFDNDATNYKLQMNGAAVMVAGGLNVFLTHNLALNASLGGSIGRVSRYRLNAIDYTNTPDIRTLRANVGLTFFIH